MCYTGKVLKMHNYDKLNMNLHSVWGGKKFDQVIMFFEAVSTRKIIMKEERRREIS